MGRSHVVTSLLVLLLTLTSASIAQGEDDVVVILEGRVVDSATGEPIEGATLSTNLDYSPVTTSPEGDFKMVLMSARPVEVRIRKDGYRDYEQVVGPEPRVRLAVRLEPQASPVTVTLSSFRRGIEMRGAVENLPTEDFADFKVVAYVLTDKWYIHPFANNTDGEGFSSIQEGGTWRLKTVWRGHQAYMLALLVVRMTDYVPPQVEVVSANPEQELLARVKAMAERVQEAPDGI